ncbi:M20/M25/M40 family metallo-hydrolase [uncultured Tenacibaculum sp.]|uniref:M20/M25/M40 family metallo-hydrolase n=1 Tax=uncultured Tenacibaculum sp. TaxID=174713 RepID=UPI00261CD13F|nr:M20/M25/M40 family metallo-hydrolase [uncultured Tenacibaculum sp.]
MKKFIKKSLIGLLTIGVLTVILIFFFPQVLYISALGQKMLMKMEGEQVAEFYFKENQTSKDTLYMKGIIYSNTLTDIKKVLDNNPQITTITMVNVGGSIDDEVNLVASQEIRKRNINTYLPKNGMVASGGTDMFLAGTKRQVHPTAKLGVHSWSGGDKVALDFPKEHEEHKKYLNYYKEMEIPTDFYWYTLKAAPADGIHWMTSEEIINYNITTDTKSELLSLQEKLSSNEFKGRGTGNNQLAQDLITTYFENVGLKKFNNTYNSPFTFINKKTTKKREGTNIIGYIKGKKYPNKYIVIGAHYDHLGIVNDTIYNGADDNASGTAALLVLAKHFKSHQPEHSIIFAAFDAEELGLHGSKFFVENPPIPLEDIQLNFNFDMISRNPKNEIYVVGTYPYQQFKSLVEKVAKTSSLKVSYGHDNPNDKTKDYWMFSSDNGPFHKKGIPNITFSEEDHPSYHKPTDDFENINPTFYKNVVKLIQKAIENIDQNFPTK